MSSSTVAMAASPSRDVSSVAGGPGVNVVVIAVDASKQSEESIQFYIEYLHRQGNHLVLLHVIELPDMSHARQAHLTPSALYELWTQEGIKSKELEKRYEEILKQKGVSNSTFRMENGLKPGEVIVTVAVEEHATMIVMGTRGMGVIRRTILGSASDYVVHHAACPVVVCRSQSEHEKHQQHRDSCIASEAGSFSGSASVTSLPSNVAL